MKMDPLHSQNETNVVSEDTFERTTHAVAQLSNYLSKHIIPLFLKHRGGKPQLVGSSFLVSSETNFYLVSAAHVFDKIKDGHELFFYTSSKTIRKLSGSLRLTKSPIGQNRTHDRLDVGVLRLEGLAMPPYPSVQKYPLPLSAFMPNALPREGKQYLLVGFPASKSRANPIAREITSELYSFRNISASASKYSELGLTPQNHIVLSFDEKRTITPNKEVRAFPAPYGMSGSPMWLLYDGNGPNDSTQTPVVGIAIEHHKGKHAIVATDIDIALKLINEDIGN